MRNPICTIDATCVIALDHIGVLPQLSLLYARVLIPKAVRAELFKRPGREERIQQIVSAYAFAENCDEYDQGAVDFLLGERAIKGLKDRGEAEAVVQAAEVGADVLIDDPWGRKLASRYDRDFHGTVWILRRFFELGLASASVTRSYFVELLDYGLRLPREAINQLLSEIGEEPIP